MILIDGKKIAADLREDLKKEVSNLNRKFLFLTKTLLIFLPFIFFNKDCRTISTSGNSGIYYYIK